MQQDKSTLFVQASTLVYHSNHVARSNSARFQLSNFKGRVAPRDTGGSACSGSSPGMNSNCRFSSKVLTHLSIGDSMVT